MAAAVKLHFLNGEQQGRVVEILPPGISLGREQDNDVVLPDSQASRYHAKIELHDDVWTLRDLESRNGVYLNGRKIEGKAPLSIRDEIRIGRCKFAFSDEDHVATKPDKQTDETKGVEAPGRPARKSLIPTLAMALVLVILSLLIVAVMLNRKPAQPGGPVTIPEGPKPEDLRVYFEHIKASKDNVYRCELRIEDGVLSAQVDDVQSNYHPSPVPEKLSGEDLESLARQLLTTEFLALQSEPASVGRLEDERYRVMVSQGRNGNFFAISNRPLPPAFREVVDLLTNKAQERFAMPIFPTPETVQEAERMYRVALDEFAKRIVNPSFLNQAAKHFTRAMKSVEWIEPKPTWYEDAVSKVKEATDELDSKVNNMLDGARLDEKSTEWRSADRKYRLVRDLLQDQKDPRHIEASKAIWRLAEKLKTQP